MRDDSLTLDKKISKAEEARARAIQYRIRGGQVRKKLRYTHGAKQRLLLRLLEQFNFFDPITPRFALHLHLDFLADFVMQQSLPDGR